MTTTIKFRRFRQDIWDWKTTSSEVKSLSLVCLFATMDCSPPGFFVHRILQARIPEWVAISFSRGSSWPRDQTQVSCIAGRFFTIWANWVVQYKWIFQINYSLAFKAPTCLIITNIKRSFHKNLYNILSPFYNSCILTRILVTKKNSSTL